MKIALFVHCFFPAHFYGTETYTYEVARHLIGMGHDVAVVTAVFPGEPSTEKMITRYEYAGIPVICIDKNHLPNQRVKDTYYQPSIRPVIESVIEELRPDLIHVTHLINHTAVLLEIAAERQIPIVSTLTDFFGICFNNRLETAMGNLCSGPNAARTNCLACYLKDAGNHPHHPTLIQWACKPKTARLTAVALNVVRKLPPLRNTSVDMIVEDIQQRPDMLLHYYKQYDAVITATHFLKDAYVANGLTVPAHSIRFGVDINREAKPRRANKHQIVFGFIGQIAPHKGTDTLIDAFNQLPEGKATLHIYGRDDNGGRYMQDLLESASGKDIQFKGTFPSEKMAEVLATIDVLVIPSRWYENSPLVLLNSLASHTPVLVSDVAGMTEFLEDGVNGMAFERGSVQGLAQCMNRFIIEPSLAQEMSLATNYEMTSKRMTERVAEVYKEVMQRHKKKKAEAVQ